MKQEFFIIRKGVYGILSLVQEFFGFCARFGGELLTMSNERFWKEGSIFFLMFALMATIEIIIFYAFARLMFNRREARGMRVGTYESLRAERWKLYHRFMPYGKGISRVIAFSMLSGAGLSGFWMVLALLIRMY